MAENVKPTVAQKPNANTPNPAAPIAGGRKPGQPVVRLSPQERLVRTRQNLQREMDRATKFLADGPTCYLTTARRAAKAGVPQEIVMKGLGLIREAVDDIEAQVKLAYAGSTSGETRSRGSL